MKLQENAVELWGKEVETAKKQQLTKEQAVIFLRIMASPEVNKSKELLEHLEGKDGSAPSMARVFWKRFKSMFPDIWIEPSVALLVESLIGGNFGKSTMIAAYMGYVAKRDGITEYNDTIFSRSVFPFGAPTEEEWQRLWTLQKVALEDRPDTPYPSSDNGLDYAITYESLKSQKDK